MPWYTSRWTEADEVSEGMEIRTCPNSVYALRRKSGDFKQDSIILGAETESDDEPIWDSWHGERDMPCVPAAANCCYCFLWSCFDCCFKEMRSRRMSEECGKWERTR
eukprot:g18552.t1